MASQNTDNKSVAEKQVQQISNKAKNFFSVASNTISKSSGVKQLAIGSASGWCTGFLATRVGKTVALSVGGSILIIAAANQAGIVNVNWDKIGRKVDNAATKMESKVVESAPSMKTSVGKYARNNRMFAAGFLGGFLLGLVS